MQFNNKEIEYSDEDIIDEILKNENLPFKKENLNKGNLTKPKNRDNNENKKNSNVMNSNNNIKNSHLNKIKNDNLFKKGYSQKLFNEFQDKYLNKKAELAYNSKKSVNVINKNLKNSYALSNSIDNILINNFDQNQIKFKDAKKQFLYNGLNTERKYYEGNNSNKKFESISIKSESADPTYRSYDKNFYSKVEKNSFNLNNRRFTNFSDNSNTTYKIENYNQFEYFNNNILNDSFSCSSDDYINFVKRKNNRGQIKKFEDNLNTTNKKLETNESKNFYNNHHIYENNSNTKSKNKINKNSQNFSIKNSNKKISRVLNDEERNYLEITPHKIDFQETSNNSKISPIQKQELNQESLEGMLKNIKISKDLEKDFRKIGIEEFERINETSIKNGIIKKNQNFSKPLLNNSNFIHEPKEKESNNNLRQKIIVRNDKVKIIHNENINNDNQKESSLRQLTPSKIEINQNKIRLVSNSPNINNSNIKDDGNEKKSMNRNSQNNEFDQKSNNNISESASNNISSLNHKYCLGNNNLQKIKEIKGKRNSLTKLIDMNALFNLSKNSSKYKNKNFQEFISIQSPESYSLENQFNFSNLNSTKNIHNINRSIFEKEKNFFKISSDKTSSILNQNEKDVVPREDENILSNAQIKNNENNKYNKLLNNQKSIKNQDNNVFDNLISNRKSLPKNLNNLSNSTNEFPENRSYNVIYTDNNYKNFLSNKKLIIGRDFKLSNEKYYSNNTNIRLDKSLSNIGDVTEFSNDRNDEFANENNNSNHISEGRSYDLNNGKTEINQEKKIIDTKKFDSFKESQLIKDINIFEIYYNLLNNFNNIKDKIFRITNYSIQIELTTETLRDQISKNYSHLSEKISSNLKGLCDNIVGINSKNNYYKRIIPNILENSKKICLFDIRLQTFEIKEFEYLTIKLNVSINIEHDGSDLIFLSGGKVNNSINFFKNEENFGDLSGQITAMFLILRWSTKAIELNGQLLRKRVWHSSLFFNNKLYIIGGASSENHKLKECECYNIIEKQWELLPNLNYARCSPGLCIYNQEYLYVFNGWSRKDCFLDTIEFINIKDFSNNSWITFKPEDPGLCWDGFSNCCATVVAENKILIFGGYKNENENKSYFFDPCKKIVYRGKDLIKPSIFYNNSLYFENKIYSLDNKNENRKIFGVHVYDIVNNTWKYYIGPQ